MKQQQSVALSAIIAVAVSLTGMSVYVDASEPELTEMESLAVESGIFGHLEVVQKNADGEVIAYRQTDNTVLTEGLECAVEILFQAGTLTSNTCNLTTPSGADYDTVQLTSTGTPAAGDEVGSTTATIITGVDGLNVANGGCTIADAAGNGSVTCSVTFTAGSGVSGQAVNGAYLADDTTPESYFAGNTFTSVTMNDSDTLDVTWTITLS